MNKLGSIFKKHTSIEFLLLIALIFFFNTAHTANKDSLNTNVSISRASNSNANSIQHWRNRCLEEPTFENPIKFYNSKKELYNYPLLKTDVILVTDSDNDGINDDEDIDDDNDGVLDVDEQNCFENVIDIESFVIGKCHRTSRDNAVNEVVLYDNITVIPGKEVFYRFDRCHYYDRNPSSAKLELFLNGVYSGEFATAGSKAGVRVIDGSLIPSTNNIEVKFVFNVAPGVGDDLGVEMTHFDYIPYSSSGTAPEVSYTCLDIDTDNDGIPNRLDLDSDGDGCSDLAESGAGAIIDSLVNENSLTPIVGSNGYADNLETIADNGLMNYGSTYDTYALDSTTNICNDNDNDGIGDFIDIDDDNDGILDVNEMIDCDTSINVTDLSIPKGTISGGYSRLSSGTYGGWTIVKGNVDIVSVGAYGWQTKGGDMIDGGSTDGKVQREITTTPGKTYSFTFYHGGHNSGPIPQYGRVEILDDNKLLNSLNIITEIKITETEIHKEEIIFTAKSSITTITLEQTSNNAGYGSVFSGMGIKEVCTNFLDTDDDGIPNHLDLDSDGDGCSDLAESGAGAIIDSLVYENSTTPIVGSNGYADNLETSIDNGIINFSTTYENYALDSAINICIDNDKDGIGDFIDIDDDNDGIIDVLELGCENKEISHNSSTTFPNCNGANSIDWETIGTSLDGGGVFNHPALGQVTLNGTSSSNIRIGTQNNSGTYLNFSNNGHTLTLTWEKPVTYMEWALGDMDFNESCTFVASGASYSAISLGATDSWNGVNTLSGTGNDRNSNPDNYSVIRIESDLGITSIDLIYSSITSNGTNSLLDICVGDVISDIDANSCVAKDSDGDGKPDYLDLDSDNDGVLDNVESQTKEGFIPKGPWKDENSNGLHDTYDEELGGVKLTLINSDNDEFPDALDTDSDNDGCFDVYEAKTGSSADENGVINSPFGTNGLGNHLEINDDYETDVNYSIDVDYRNKDINACISNINGVAFLDCDADGLYKVGDDVFDNIKIKILNKSTNTFDSTLTDANGKYTFEISPLIDYDIFFGIPSSYVVTNQQNLNIANGNHLDLSGKVALKNLIKNFPTELNGGFKDNEAPILTGIPQGKMICSEEIDFSAVTAIDNISTVEIKFDSVLYQTDGKKDSIKYIWTATDECNNSTKDSSIFIYGSDLAVKLFPDTVKLCQTNSALLSARPINGEAPYYFQWTTPVGSFNNANSNAPILSIGEVVDDFFATVLLTDANGCQVVDKVQVIIQEKTDFGTISGDSIYCEKDSIKLVADNGDYYQWKGPNDFVSYDKELIIPTAQLIHNGEFEVKVTTDAGCSSTITKTVQVNRSATPKITFDKNEFCFGEIIEMSARGLETTTYKWESDFGFESNEQNISLNSEDLGVGKHTLHLYVDPLVGCDGSTQTEITVLETTPVSFTPDTAVCLGANIKLETIGASSVFWTGPNNFFSFDSSFTLENISKEQLGTYNAEVTTSNNCNITREITITELSSNFLINLEPNNCIGDSLLFSIDANVFETYNWTINGEKYTSPSPIVENADGETNFQVTLEGINDNCKLSSDTIFSIEKNPFNDILISKVDQDCENKGSITISNMPQGFSILWNDGSNLQSRNDLNQGTHSFIIANSDGCSKTYEYRIINNCDDEDLILIEGKVNLTCTNTNVDIDEITIHLMNVNNDTIKTTLTNKQGDFSFSNIAFTDVYLLVDLGEKSTNYEWVENEFYSPSENKIINLNSGTNKVNLLVNDSQPIVFEYPSKVCVGSTILLKGVTENGNWLWKYLDKSNDAVEWIIKDELAVGEHIFQVSWSNSLGCQVDSTFKIEIEDFPANISLPSDTVLCIGSSLSLEVLGSEDITWYSDKWDSPSSENPIQLSNLQEGTELLVEVQTENGCSIQKNIDIEIQRNDISLSYLYLNCDEESLKLFVEGNADTYTWTTPNKEKLEIKNATINTVSEGMYFLESSKNGCYQTDSILVNIDKNENEISSELTHESCGSKNGEILINTPISNESLRWVDLSQTTEKPKHRTGLEAGVYTLIYSSGNCLDSIQYTITNECSNQNADKDGDGILDKYDLDDDNDGIPDHLEGEEDTDGDGILDKYDIDSDNDGILDAIEVGYKSSIFEDKDKDGLRDDFNVTILFSIDEDGDGIPNFKDIDSDNDGIVDWIESQITTEKPIMPLGIDRNQNGLDDEFEFDDNQNWNLPVDTDEDSVYDYLDTDSDGDSYLDIEEAFNKTPINKDSDNDGLDDAFDEKEKDENISLNAINKLNSIMDFPKENPNNYEPDFRKINIESKPIESDTFTVVIQRETKFCFDENIEILNDENSLIVNQEERCIFIKSESYDIHSIKFATCFETICDTNYLYINTVSPTKDTIDIFWPENEATVSFCLDTSEVGSNVIVNKLCGNDLSVNELQLDNDLCIELEGVLNKGDELCYELCNEDGICDTTVIKMINDVTRVKAFDDNLTLVTGASTIFLPLENDLNSNNLANIEIIGTPVYGSVSILENNELEYEHSGTKCDVLDSIIYVVKQGDITDTAIIHIHIICDPVVVYSAISPNGDGMNDELKIRGIERYPINTISIFNRYGNEVFRVSNFQNKNGWNGQSNGRFLPDGTYFYVLKVEGEEEFIKSGYIQLMR